MTSEIEEIIKNPNPSAIDAHKYHAWEYLKVLLIGKAYWIDDPTTKHYWGMGMVSFNYIWAYKVINS